MLEISLPDETGPHPASDGFHHAGHTGAAAHSARYSGRGWTPALKARFLDHLASRGNVRAACARVGLSAEAAYRLRRRDPLFARCWAAAIVLARDTSEQVLADRAIDGVEEQVWHRGELVGSRRRYDARLLLAHLARLDRLADEEAAGEDAGRFDELVARIAGADMPEGLRSDDGVLPLPREQAVRQAEREAELSERWSEEEDGFGNAWDDEEEDECDWEEDEEERLEREAAELAQAEAERRAIEREDRINAAAARGRELGEAKWDGWHDLACGVVDEAAGWPASPTAAGLPGSGDPPPPFLARGLPHCGAATAGEPMGRKFPPCTVSTVSTSALTRALAGPPRFTPPDIAGRLRHSPLRRRGAHGKRQARRK